MNQTFTGVIPPVITPLTANGEFDVDSFARVIERLIRAGVDGVFLLGSSGEAVFCTDARRRQILEAGVRIVAGRVPVLAGVIDTQTERVVEQALTAQEVGVDALVATAPFYALGGLEVVERHFRVLRERVDLPLFAYDIPVCVHTKLDPRMLLRLGREGVIAGVKDSSGDDGGFRQLVRSNELAGRPLSLFTGHEVVVDGAYLSGAHGSVPGLANVAPEPYVRQWQAAQAGQWEQARREQDRLADLMTIVSVTQGVTGYAAGVGAFKTALSLMGVIATNQMTEPVSPLGEENSAAIASVLQTQGLL
ncbi:dihydrodipicolinate synthase family protein [Nesterenkonia haasae]|uniref:dihydrodipicolinate synthase family protein n=1 Tax=Nesterenkonia haasae TaxID=2587813 RepID=UPI001391AAD0|nr:dihydrodipicolinate synthase family protein [Nesterenkonia haasae]NDK31685.1 dihydrodipicolinate synthase family protein [Nesterenkonia haasae]